jgi:hypothetical protein
MKKSKHRRDRVIRPEPRYLIATMPAWHEIPSAAALGYFWGAVKNRHYTPVRFIGGGERFQCFANVSEHILTHGGSAVVGWSFQPGPPRPEQRNRLSGCLTDTHVVWRSPEGELLDLTPGYEKFNFIADPWGSTSNVSFWFCDHKRTLPRFPSTRTLGFPLPKRPVFQPLPTCLLSGQAFADQLMGRRFTDDQHRNDEIHQSLKALVEIDLGSGQLVVAA